MIKVTPPEKTASVTKRTISSVIAKLYDPLGLLAPVTVRAKLMLQSLWIKRLDWDTQLDSQLLESWNKAYQELQSMDGITEFNK